MPPLLRQDLWDHLKLSPPRYDSYEAACAAVAELEAAEAAAAASGLAAIEEEEESEGEGEGPEDGGDGASEGGSDGEEDAESQGGGDADEEDVARCGAGGRDGRGCRVQLAVPHAACGAKVSGVGSGCRATTPACVRLAGRRAAGQPPPGPAAASLPPMWPLHYCTPHRSSLLVGPGQDGERGGGGCAHGAPRLRHAGGG